MSLMICRSTRRWTCTSICNLQSWETSVHLDRKWSRPCSVQ